MKLKIGILIAVGVALLMGLTALGKGKAEPVSQAAQTPRVSGQYSVAPSPTPRPAEQIEVVHFHATQQCWACITVGEYALQTIEERFGEEYTSGKITYQDINGELAENQEMVMRYKARGSSLYINAVREGKDDIVEEVAVWRLVGNQAQFMNYFEGRLRALLGE